ncbi:hypothetical protein ColTof4_11902 [Colletotrichum tofieldiae]|nr:hypothetical protein ColTof3_03025 [Colletotrichum tofieldiae]GKT79479.1 hypothetical protein ColTof4_11902 [Colletotrichum tofieldiae]
MHEQILKKIEDEKATRDQLLERLNKSRNLIAQWEQLLVMSLSAPSPGQDTNKGTKTPDTTNHNETFKGTPDATKSGGKVNGEPVNSQHPPTVINPAPASSKDTTQQRNNEYHPALTPASLLPSPLISHGTDGIFRLADVAIPAQPISTPFISRGTQPRQTDTNRQQTRNI